ncbi:PREDICTED: proproteinase E-like, partial [Acanthisitta chloris]|uniref:proproteinase E-like n=1 Tax=Acanthisitta chloris TaxID=57068 RepID=UPI0004F0FA13
MATGEGPEQAIPVNSDDIFVHPKWLSICAASGGDLPDKLQQAELPVVDYEHCTQPDWWGALAIRHTMICAGGAEKAGCNHGIASFVSALGCNAAKKPTVFTRVSAFEDWIRE